MHDLLASSDLQLLNYITMQSCTHYICLLINGTSHSNMTTGCMCELELLEMTLFAIVSTSVDNTQHGQTVKLFHTHFHFVYHSDQLEQYPQN